MPTRRALGRLESVGDGGGSEPQRGRVPPGSGALASARRSPALRLPTWEMGRRGWLTGQALPCACQVKPGPRCQVGLVLSEAPSLWACTSLVRGPLLSGLETL